MTWAMTADRQILRGPQAAKLINVWFLVWSGLRPSDGHRTAFGAELIGDSFGGNSLGGD